MSTLHENHYTFMITFHLIVHSIISVFQTGCRESQTHILYPVHFFRKSCSL